jgi:hypothetical protein
VTAPKSDGRLAEAGLVEGGMYMEDYYWELLAEVARARAELAAETTRRMQAEEQRDEARRAQLELESEGDFTGHNGTPIERARARGWDCYPEGEGGS